MNGSVTIAPQVLISMISHTALDVPGVSRMGTVPARHMADRLRGSYGHAGVVVRVDGSVQADIYLVAQHDVNLLDLGGEVQAAVTNALQELVGLPVQEINIVVQDVDTDRLA